MKKHYFFLISALLLISIVSAIPFIPNGDVWLMNVYSVVNAKNVTSGLFIGNGSLPYNTCNDQEIMFYNTSLVGWQCGSSSVGSGDITAVSTNGRFLIGGTDSGAANLLLNTTAFNDTYDSRYSGGAGAADGNASSICNNNEVLLGQDSTTCVNINDTIDDRDTDTDTWNKTDDFNAYYSQDLDGNSTADFNSYYSQDLDGNSTDDFNSYYSQDLDGNSTADFNSYYHSSSLPLGNNSNEIFLVCNNNSFYPYSSNPSGYLTSYTEIDPRWGDNYSNLENHDCTGQVAVGIYPNGTFVCEQDNTGGAGAEPDGNVTSICGDNEVLLGQDSTLCIHFNNSIDDRDRYNDSEDIWIVVDNNSFYPYSSNPSGYLTSYTEIDPLWDANYSNMQSDCYAGNYSYGIYPNGTFKCRGDSGAGTDTTILTENQYNATQFDENSGTLNIIMSWIRTILLPIEDQRYNETTYVNTQNTTMTAYVDANAGGDNASWNQSHANTLYSQDLDGNSTDDFNAYYSQDLDGNSTSDFNAYYSQDLDGNSTADFNAYYHSSSEPFIANNTDAILDNFTATKNGSVAGFHIQKINGSHWRLFGS